MNLLAFITVGPIEVAVVALVIVVLFGNRIPSAMRSLGQTWHQFRAGMQETKSQIEEVQP